MANQYSRAAFWKRLVVGTSLVIVAAASATSVAAFREIDAVVDALKNGGLDLGGELAETESGKPQTIMLLGSDRRPNDPRTSIAEKPRSDTVMLVRLDPGKGAALMSLPRDLKVEIPGHGTGKLNSAYAYGGPKLTLTTVKRLTGLRINHVINVDFEGFRQAVNELGCLYVDVDRRYYNDNSAGGEEYAKINVKQGYQRLCGRAALNYVRFRHEDNDLVRSARQQSFLRQARDQVSLGDLLGDRSRLIKIFGRYTRSDIQTRQALLRLAKLVLALGDKPVREIHFEGEIGASFVTASSAKVRELAREFLGVQDTKGPRGAPGRKSGGARPKRRRPAPEHPTLPDLELAPTEGQAQARMASRAGFPIYYPRLRTKGALFGGDPRVYHIAGDGRERYRAYRMVIARGQIGEYYGLQGTKWLDAPILKDPTETRTVGDREFRLHYEGDRLQMVSWQAGGAAYWVSNTLLQTLTAKQMLAIAESTRVLPRTRRKPRR